MIDSTLSDDNLGKKYNVKRNRDWNIKSARESMRSMKNWRSKVIRCAYRPFDYPYCFFGTEFMDYPRRELVEHVLGRENICLVVSRQIGTADWRHAFVADGPPNDCLISDQSSEANYVLPLWRFDAQSSDKDENFSSSFRAFIDSRYEHHYTPEETLGYIYAVLYAPTYRRRYAEFLRIDFPRVPFPERADDFETLSELGWELIEAHLLRNVQRKGLAKYHGKGDHTVEAVYYSPKEQSISINATQSFKPVPQEVWDFHIGGYQVLDKYLKSRKGRKLSLDEINHVAAVADSLAFTIEQMANIDKAYQRAFGQRG